MSDILPRIISADSPKLNDVLSSSAFVDIVDQIFRTDHYRNATPVIVNDIDKVVHSAGFEELLNQIVS